MAAPAGVLGGSRRALTIGLVAVVTIVGFEALAVATALPAAQKDLGGLRLYGWAFSGFFLATLIGITAAGNMCDRYGPARPFVAGIALFTLGLIVAGLAPDMTVLVIGRVVQGVGAGAIPPIAYVVVARGYEEALRPRMFAIMSSAWIIPALAGPAIAGAISDYASWRLVFLGLPPFIGACLVLVLPSLRRMGPPERPADAPSRLGATALLAVAGGLAIGAATSRSPWTIAPLALGAAAIAWPAFRLAFPAGTWRAARGLPAVVAVMGLLNLSFFGTDAFVPLTLTEVHDHGRLVAGLPLTVAALAWTAGSWVVDRAAASRDRRGLVRAGLLLIVAGTGVLMLALVTTAPVLVAMAGWGIAGAGMGLAYPTVSLITLSAAAEGEQGAVTATVKLSENLGAALGTGVCGALIAAGDAGGWRSASIALSFALMAAVAAFGATLTQRMPAAA